MSSIRRPGSLIYDEGEDELVTPGRTARITSRKAARGTPYRDLKKLAITIRESSISDTELPSARSSASQKSARTGRNTGGTPHSTRLNRPPRPVPRKKPPPATPHAARALQQRRAATAITPGRDRRRSGRQQRVTPRDFLRQLSRVEAPITAPVGPSPSEDRELQGPRKLSSEDHWDVNSDQRPQFSVDLEEDSFQAPPRLSIEGDHTALTYQSVEAPRHYFANLGHYGSSDIATSDHSMDINDFPSYGEDRPPIDSLHGDERVNTSDLGQSIPLSDAEDLQTPVESDNRHLGERERLPGEQIYVNPDTSFAIDVPQLPVESESLNLETLRQVTRASSLVRDNQNSLSSLEHQFSNSHVTMYSKRPETDGSAESVAKRKGRISHHGIEYTGLPTGVIKKLIYPSIKKHGVGRPKIGRSIIEAVSLASDWFLEQVSHDLRAYAAHAGRRTIEERDVTALMTRQRILTATSTPFALAQRYLPRELLQDIKVDASLLR